MCSIVRHQSWARDNIFASQQRQRNNSNNDEPVLEKMSLRFFTILRRVSHVNWQSIGVADKKQANKSSKAQLGNKAAIAQSSKRNSTR